MDAAATQRVLEAMADWRRGYEHGGIRVRAPRLKPGEFYVARVPFVGAALLAPGGPDGGDRGPG